MSSELRYVLKRVRSILTLVMPVLVVSAGLYFYSFHAYEKIIIGDSSKITAAVEKNIDARLFELVRFAKNMEISGANATIRSLDGPISEVSADMYRLSVKMRDFLNTNSLAQKMYIYYPNIDYVVADQGCYRASSFYVLQFPPRREGYDAWIRYLMQPHTGELALIDMPAGSRFCYIDQLTRDNEPTAVLVIELNNEALNGILASYAISENFAAAILLRGSPIISAGSGELLSFAQEKYFQQPDINTVEEIGENYVFYNPSAFPHVGYLAVYTSQGLMHSMLVVYRICLLGLLICFLFILLISVFISRKQTAVMCRLIKKVYTSGDFPLSDEYAFISNKIDQMITEKYKNEQAMLEYQSRLNSLCLTNILQSKAATEAEIFTIAERYGVSLEYSQYRVCVMEGDFNLPGAEATAQKLQELATAAMIDCLVSYDNGEFFILLNGDDVISDGYAGEIAKKFIDAAFHGAEAHAGIGLCYDSADRIKDSYEQASAALRASGQDSSHPIKLFSHAKEDKRADTGAGRGGARSKGEASAAGRARELILEDFSNPLMGLYYVADELGVSNSYLSTAFKNVYGTGIIQYINGLRIERAKQLILTTDKSIKEIARLVGFSSDINFIRVFKKYESTTPSTYRNTR